MKYMYNEYYTDERLSYPLEKFDEVISEVSKRRSVQSQNRYIMLHFKIMHYPYLSSTYLTNRDLLKEVFTKDEISLIDEYIKNPESYPEKYSFFQMTFGDEKFKKLYFNNSNQYVAYATDVASVDKWKKSKNFDMDFSIMLKSYRLRLKDFDRLVGKLWDFYTSVESDTALVLGGDHGESLLEHDYISHGTIPYDEVIKFFQAVHFPGQKEKVIYDHQISQKSLGIMIEDIVLGNRNEKNFLENSFMRHVDNHILSFSCAGDIASLRDVKGWKFIYHIPEERFSLFNLKLDPNETTDLSNQNDELVMQYKTLILDHLSRRVVSPDICFR
jgi:arylsulfatase A-like enzyme